MERRKKRQKKVSPEMAKDVLHRVAEGETYSVIASQMGISTSTVARIVHEAGVKPVRQQGQRGKGKHKRKDAVENIVKVAYAIRVDPAASLQAITDETGVSEPTVIRALEILLLIHMTIDEDTVDDAIKEFFAQQGLEALSAEEMKMLAAVAHERWRACTAGAWGIARSVLEGHYYRTADTLLRLLRRFKKSSESEDCKAVACAIILPSPVLHPIPKDVHVGRSMVYTRRAAEFAARAQARQQRAGEAVAPGTQVLGAYAMLVSASARGKTKEFRNEIIASLLRTAISQAVMINADTKVRMITDKAITELLKQCETPNEMDELYTNIQRAYRRAVRQACIEAFFRGRKSLRSRVRRQVLAWAGMVVAAANFPMPDGAAVPAEYFQQVENEIAAAAAFFPADPPPAAAVLVQRWKAQNSAALRWAEKTFRIGIVTKKNEKKEEANVQRHSFSLQQIEMLQKLLEQKLNALGQDAPIADIADKYKDEIAKLAREVAGLALSDPADPGPGGGRVKPGGSRTDITFIQQLLNGVGYSVGARQ